MWYITGLSTNYFNLQFMFHYLKTLEDWFEKDEWKKYPIAKSSAAFLQVIFLYLSTCISLICKI